MTEETKEESLEKKARQFLNDFADLEPEPAISLVEKDQLEILPGTAEAQVAGCICDAVANSDGKGLFEGQVNWQGKVIYTILDGCPIHDGKL